jgi:hypothetical protein
LSDPEVTSRSAKATVFGDGHSVAKLVQLQRKLRAGKLRGLPQSRDSNSLSEMYICYLTIIGVRV